MDLSIKQRIFPSSENQEMLSYDLEGLWSISLPSDAELITNIIKAKVLNSGNMFDGTGGLGGNVISFAKFFKCVTTCELNSGRFKMLENNLKIFGIQNVLVYNGNCMDILFNKTYSAYFFDPPWGGPEYKYNDKTTIKLGDCNLVEVIEKIREKSKSPIFMKLPGNYDLEEFSKFNYNIDKIKNYLLLSIF